MNDAFYEQLVARKSRLIDMILRILIIVVIVAVALFGVFILGFLSVILAVILGFLAYYFVFPRLNVEYEYSLLNHDLDIAAIYSKQNRKAQLSIDIQQAEIIAPKDSPKLRSYNPVKTRDFSSGTENGKAYAIMIPIDQQLNCIIIEPDNTMLNHMRDWMGSKLFLD